MVCLFVFVCSHVCMYIFLLLFFKSSTKVDKQTNMPSALVELKRMNE